MTLPLVPDHIGAHAPGLAQALSGVMRSATALSHTIADQPWAVPAFAALASVIVTLLTVRLWPRHAATSRDALDVRSVHRLARRGLGTSDIARRTGLSYDAVATIVRSGALGRAERVAPMRKTRPSAA